MRNRVNMLTTAAVEAPGDIEGVRLPVVFHYDPADPLAVTLSFWGDKGGVNWVIARDLLHDGLAGISGVGDLTAWVSVSDQNRYYLRIKSGPAVTLFSLETNDIQSFLSLAYDSVAAGDEMQAADVDAELNAILGEAA